MTRLSVVICAISLFCSGCGNKTAPQAVAPASTNAVSGAPSQGDISALLAELTQVLRKFSVEQRRVPASLNELVGPGYLQALPQAPAGKTFAIDPKTLQVIVN